MVDNEFKFVRVSGAGIFDALKLAADDFENLNFSLGRRAGFAAQFLSFMDFQENSRNGKTIALLTDFGNRDYFVAAMKGVILSISPAVQIVDITHEIEPQEIAAASFVLRACCRSFPEKTIFVAVVDPGVGSSRRAILVETDDYFFVAPDNGLLSFVFDEFDAFRVYELTERKYFAARISSTFHGRDVFAPVAAHLAKGVKPQNFGREIKDFVRFEESRPRPVADREIEAEIIEIDRFGNLITNLRREDLPARFLLEIGETKIDRMQSFFAASEPGALFMIFGSADFLEIAVFQGSAQNMLKARRGQKLRVLSL